MTLLGYSTARVIATMQLLRELRRQPRSFHELPAALSGDQPLYLTPHSGAALEVDITINFLFRRHRNRVLLPDPNPFSS